MKKRKMNKFQKAVLDRVGIKKVSKIRRGLAVGVDWYLSSMFASIPILYIYSVVSGKAETPTSLALMKPGVGIITGMMGIMIVSLYYIVIPLRKNKGQTLGKRLLGIKVVQDDGSDVNAKVLLKREILGVALIEGGIVASSKYFREILLVIGLSKVYEILVVLAMIIPFVSIVIMLFSKNSKMLHDFIGRTKVVEIAEGR